MGSVRDKFGAWAIGGTWGDVDDKESMEALHRAVDLGVNSLTLPMCMETEEASGSLQRCGGIERSLSSSQQRPDGD